METCIFVKIS